MEEFLTPILETVLYGLGTVAFTLVGVAAELTSFDYFAAGNTTFAAWLAVVGAVALYAGVVALGAEELLPRLRGDAAGNAEQ